MARSGVNKALVQQARDTLLARGERPSIEAVRIELGNTGSKSTIHRYLTELDSEEPRPPSISLSEEVNNYVASLVQRLAADAQNSVAADRARLERQQATYLHQRQIDQARHDELQKIHRDVLDERREGLERERLLNQRLHQLEGERQRLLANDQHQQNLLRERAEQIQSLEGKHQHARQSLEHYREQQIQLREEETNRYESKIAQLQLEQRRLQEQLLLKQEELSNLYRDLERLTAEQQSRTIDVRTLSQELNQYTVRQQQINISLQNECEVSESLRRQLAVCQEKLLHYARDKRQDQRVLRVQTQQLNQLQQLLVVQHEHDRN